MICRDYENNHLIYVSENTGLKYELLDGVTIGGKETKTSDICFIILMNADIDTDEHFVGWLFGSNLINDKDYIEDYNEEIGKIVTAYELKNEWI